MYRLIRHIISVSFGLSALMVCIFFLSNCSPEIPREIKNTYDELPQEITYNFHVKPILSENCFSCHGPDESKLKSGVRLDIDNTHFNKSDFVKRIISAEPAIVMPPPESKIALSDKDKAILIKWIDQGANYETHWAFNKLSKPKSPHIEQNDWSINEIDLFVLDNLNKNNLTPSKSASKEHLIRRASFDITGLPPSLVNIDNFISSNDDKAYDELLNEMLNQNSYGERMAAYWMEIARYTDSDGYLDDKHRDFSPYRDWVINAFNDNMSYDEFVSWQIAGDQMEDPTQEQILATAFNRLHKKNSEAGIVLEEYRTEYVADRVNTFSKAFLGMTMDCARCHSHKYDPISQEDYYSLFAFFNSTNEIGHAVYGPDITPGPSLLLTDNEKAERIAFINSQIENEEKELQRIKSSNNQASQQADLSNSILSDLSKQTTAYYSFDKITVNNKGKSISANSIDRNTPATVVEPLQIEGIKGKALLNSDYSNTTLGKKIGWYDRTDPFSIDLWIKPAKEHDDASVFLHCEDWRLGNKGYSLYLTDNHLRFQIAKAYPQNAVEIKSKDKLVTNKWTHVTVTYDGSSKASGLKIYLNGKLAEVNILLDHLYKGILYVPDIHTYGFNGIQLGKKDGVKPMEDGAIDEFRVFSKEISALEIAHLHNQIAPEEIKLDDSFLSNKELLEAHNISIDKSVIQQNAKLKALRDSLNLIQNSIKEIMVMGDLEEPRPTYMLDRGLYSAAGKEVYPNTPNVILAFDESLPQNRLGLSKWLFHDDNPLTARVFVNHIWQMHFGTGLVKTTEDFGNQGSLPTHPELLDWLASTFIESGWDIKALHKLIMSSATYRQSSEYSDELLASDPENKLLARMNRFRLPAEMIRDNALAISGLLVDNIGGPSVYPYQPEGLWDEISNKHWRYPYLQEAGDGLYRRSLYTIWKRTAPPPSMLIFDSNDRTVCTVKRKTTNTPLQALVLLNDPQYIESARALSEKILQVDVSDDAEYIDLACRYTLGRLPKENEKENLLSLYKKELVIFKNDQQAVDNYLSIGYRNKLEYVQKEKNAALAVIVNALMNTDEGNTRS